MHLLKIWRASFYVAKKLCSCAGLTENSTCIQRLTVVSKPLYSQLRWRRPHILEGIMRHACLRCPKSFWRSICCLICTTKYLCHKKLVPENLFVWTTLLEPLRGQELRLQSTGLSPPFPWLPLMLSFSEQPSHSKVQDSIFRWKKEEINPVLCISFTL